MITSMTGFARCADEAEWGQATIEIRSVNHRYLDVSFKWPDWCRGLEEKAKQIIKQKFSRGKVDVYLHWQPSAAIQPDLSLNTELVNKLSDIIKATSTLLPNAVVNTMEVLRWPDVVRVGQWQTAQVEAPLLALLEEAVAQLHSAREQEGGVLAKIINEKVLQLISLTERVRAQSVINQGHVRERLLKQLNELQQVQPERFEQELVFLLHRLDTVEELDRLNAHCQSVQNLLNQADPVGRRLDFIMQELGREANTLSAKSGDNIISEMAIDMKVLIEQMREQIQNLE
jgi:uncharacterized protein (TIGR00255 family)